LCVGTIARTFPLIENVAVDEALKEVTELKFDCFIQQASNPSQGCCFNRRGLMSPLTSAIHESLKA
jgi:hypothetical protein